ncbi:MAG: peptide-methionine (S)-S-oxide reductase, partial [Nitrospirota bacterium]|nr:peptide-methionine (S)-S-oxide reductase [Nitrospirota bacterium]
EPAGMWYEAEPYHQEYFARNPYQGYCTAIVAPKVVKFRKLFTSKLKA